MKLFLLAALAPALAGCSGMPGLFEGPPPQAQVAAGTIWEVRPTPADIAAARPLADGQPVNGRVGLDCVVQADRRLICESFYENPKDKGLVAAALKLSEGYRARRKMPDGSSPIGAKVAVPIVFADAP